MMRSTLLTMLLLTGCIGTFSFPGFELDGDDDDSAVGDDDDVTPPLDDDDATGDDDDATPIGGPVFCGLELSAPEGNVAAYTGGADWDFDFDDGGGLLYAAEWTGCEAEHFWDADAEILCGIRWEGAGDAYVAQFQSDRLVMRFEVRYTLAENTCRSNHPDARDRTTFYRVEIPYGDGDIVLRVGESPQTSLPQMDLWATVPYVGQGDEPDDFSIDYATGFEAWSP